MEKHPEGLSEQELQAEDGQALPDREAMSTITPDLSNVDNFAMPINEALAINNLSNESVAYADADQTVVLGQADTEESEGQDATARPDREAMSTLDVTPPSLLDIDANIHAALDVAAPIDAAVA